MNTFSMFLTTFIYGTYSMGFSKEHSHINTKSLKQKFNIININIIRCLLVYIFINIT